MSGVAVEHRRPETAEEMKIRDAVESDLPAIIKIYNAAVATRVATAQLEQVTLEEQRGWLKEHSADRHPFWVLEIDRQIADPETFFTALRLSRDNGSECLCRSTIPATRR